MRRLLLPCCLCLPWTTLALDFPSTPPLEPQEAAKSFHVLDGFELQLIAAEPLVTDPVALTYDADGRAYVCEMNDYPYTDKATHKPSQENPTDQSIGRVRLLTDTDGDGVFDKATVFAEGLSWPTGAACWKGGIFVTATPDVWYLKDTNDDGVADVRQKVFTGFEKLNVQAVMNNPIWGLDHRIYIAGGSNGGEIQRAPGSESVMPLPKGFKPLSIKRNDFSFDPSTGDVRLESGGARFGNTFDDWGNRFLCNIRNPCQHVVLPYRYLARNPYLVVPSALNDCAEAGDQLPVYRTSPPEPWREFRAKRWTDEGSKLPNSELVGAGVVTSSSGITVYRGDAYPPEYRDFAFVADVAGNLFYRMKLVPNGVTFNAVQVDGNANFCTSDDLWFRPVNFTNAPDGCLHVCDMYREVIEHPWSIPDDIHTAVDLLRGRDKGRLWRLAPKGGATVSVARKAEQPRSVPHLTTATTPELITLLDHPNAWHRETAHRLLFERQDKTAVEPLRELVQKEQSLTKLQALWALEGMSRLTDDDLLHHALDDGNPYLREAGVVLFAPRLKKDGGIWGGVSNRLSDSSSRVRFAACLAIGSSAFTNLWHQMGDVAIQAKDDPWLRAAAQSFPVGLVAFSVEELMERPVLETPGLIAFVHDCGVMFGSNPNRQSSVWDFFLSALSRGSSRKAAAAEAGLQGMCKGLARHGKSPLDASTSEKNKYWLHTMANQAATDAENSSLPVEVRERKIALLAVEDDWQKLKPLVRRLLDFRQDDRVQLATVQMLGQRRDTEVADMLIEVWAGLSPLLRETAVTLLLSRTDRIAKLLDAIEAKKISPAQLSVAAKATLGRQKTPALAERIANLIGNGSSTNRTEVINTYLVAMGLKERDLPSPGGSSLTPGDATRGSKIYETACMVCHKFAGKGNDIGPHLGTIKAWTPEQLLTNILDPNREVSPNFALYLVETHDGRTLSGLIASETAGNLTLKRADGGTDTVLRSEIKSLSSPGISLMPEGLEAAITPAQMADLVHFLTAP
jgi:putative membrane-bound dehydrogenase-like protein